MFYIEEAEMVKSASHGTVLNSDSRRECEEIMERVRREDPTYFPYGCDIHGHVATGGNVYMIRSASTKKAVGFTGWQEFQEKSASGQPIKVGYYSIGVLPEYRQQGFAKAAITQLLRIKAATVDQVKAFVVPHNSRSIRLAERLGIPVVHDA